MFEIEGRVLPDTNRIPSNQRRFSPRLRRVLALTTDSQRSTSPRAGWSFADPISHRLCSEMLETNIATVSEGHTRGLASLA